MPHLILFHLLLELSLILILLPPLLRVHATPILCFHEMLELLKPQPLMHFSELFSISLVFHFLVHLFHFFIKDSLLFWLSYFEFYLLSGQFGIKSKLVSRCNIWLFLLDVEGEVKALDLLLVAEVIGSDSHILVHEPGRLRQSLDVAIELQLLGQDSLVLCVHWVNHFSLAWRLGILT